jgi:two-component system sensor histidine kinase CiaH
MFETARLKLTFFYLAILLFFSLSATWGLRAFAQAEFNRANNIERSLVHEISREFFGPQFSRESDRSFARQQRAQNQETLARLSQQTVVMNVAVLIFGGLLSYWYAGRTLRPIQEAHERQKRFTSDASHELRTPLASMKLENELFLRQKQFSDAEVREQISSNLEEVARLERLTTSLLDLNRYGNSGLTKRKLDIRKVADEAVAHAKAVEAAKANTFHIKVSKATVVGNYESLVQLLGILLENAVKYGPEDGVIEVHGAKQGNDYVLTVRDHGTGIADEDLPHVFERMYRGDKARSSRGVSGHGIGLSLAQQIAEANEARLEAANHPEGGAVFTLYF